MSPDRRHDCLALELVQEPIERAWVDPRSQCGLVWSNAVAPGAHRRPGRKASADGLVHDVLERLPLPMNLLFKHSRDVGIERQGGSHASIMMPRGFPRKSAVRASSTALYEGLSVAVFPAVQIVFTSSSETSRF